MTTDHYRSFVPVPSDARLARWPSFARAAEVYEALAPALGFPPHFGANPDALWDVLSEHQALIAVLKAAADAGLLSFN